MALAGLVKNQSGLGRVRQVVIRPDLRHTAFQNSVTFLSSYYRDYYHYHSVNKAILRTLARTLRV